MEQVGFILCEFAFVCAGVLFNWNKERRDNFRFRICISSVIAAVTILMLSIFVGEGYQPMNILLQVVMVVLLVVFMKMNWKISFSVAIYNMIWVRVTWWMLLEMIRIFLVAVAWHIGKLYIWNMVLAIIMFFLISLLAWKFTIIKWVSESGRKVIGPRQLTSAILIGLIFETLAYMPELQNITAGFDRWMVLFLLQLICVFVLYLQNELFRKSALKQELELMNMLLLKEQEQYRLSKENIAIINQKCHDLKHQIRAIRKSDETDKSQYLKEVEDSIRIYESIVKTGNEVLDTILTEKSLYCRDRGITVSCVADGSLLSFMQNMDLYSLFGNALDNAIEAVEKFSEDEMRQIDVLIHRQQNFLVINVVNPVREPLLFEEGLPITTKADKTIHGFGMRSMKYIVKKYEGFLNASEEDGCFSLKILIPLPN